MTPAEIGPADTIMSSREQVNRDRQRRQTYTFLTVFALVFMVGLVALGNWRSWWTIGGGEGQVAASCPVQTATDPRLTNVNVTNGTTRRGLATAVAKELQKRQFRVLTIATAEPDKPITTVAQVHYGPSGALAARTVALQFPAKVKMIKDRREDATVDVVLGNKYKRMVPGAEAAAAIKLKEDPEGCVQPSTTPAPEPSGS